MRHGFTSHKNSYNKALYTLLRLLIAHLINVVFEETQRLSTTTPLQRVAKEHLVVALRDSRESVRQLTTDKATIIKKLTTECVPVNDSMHKSLKDVIIGENITDPFLKMFWCEQSKAFGRQNGGRRWHPMLIRFAILIHSQSSCAYNTLRQTGELKLPTLRDYITSMVGQRGKVIADPAALQKLLTDNIAFQQT